MNVLLIYLSESIFWKKTKDHSKWAVSAQENEINLHCTGDLNRGGGTVSSINREVYQSFFKIIGEADKCAK